MIFIPRKTIYNDLTSPEQIEKISKENKELVKEYIGYLKSISRAKTTIQAYQSDCDIFFVWNMENNNNKFFIDLTKRDVIRYQNYCLEDLHHSPNRLRRLKATLSSLSNFIEAILDDTDGFKGFRNIINKIPNPEKQPTREKTILTEEQIKYLLDYLVEHKKYSEACVLALALASGSRKSELLRFKVSYFTYDNIIYDSLYKTPEKIKTKGRSKGKMLEKFTLVKRFKPYFDMWIKQREEFGITREELFWNYRQGEWILSDISTLNSYALTFSKILNCDFYWHSCRHFFTTYLAESGLPIEVIKEICGWSEISMVSLYTDTKLENTLGKYFSADGIRKQEKKELTDL